MLRFRKARDKYHFDVGFYLIVLAFAAVIGGVYYYGKRIYERSRGAEVQALLVKENLSTIEAYRKQAGNWVNSRARGKDLTAKQRKEAEEIIAQGLFQWTNGWIQDRMNNVPKSESDRKQQVLWDAAKADLDRYLDGVEK